MIEYPQGLPCPQASVVTPSERRTLSAERQPREARQNQVDRLEFERLTWPPMSPEKCDTLLNWWRGNLVFGGAWFSAGWPLPRGMVTAVRKFREQPKWEFIAGGMWRISALCEVRGRGMLPSAPDFDPLWGNVLLLLSGRQEVTTDSSRYARSLTASGLISLDDEHRLFDKPMYKSPAGGTNFVGVEDTSVFPPLLGNQESCLELFLQPASAGSADYFFSLFTYQVQWQYATQKLTFTLGINGSAVSLDCVGFPVGGDPVHAAFVRDNSDSSHNKMKLYVAGALVATSGDVSGAVNLAFPSQGRFFCANSKTMDVWMAQMRLTGGVPGAARYYADFEPPTAAFPTTGPT